MSNGHSIQVQRAPLISDFFLAFCFSLLLSELVMVEASEFKAICKLFEEI